MINLPTAIIYEYSTFLEEKGVRHEEHRSYLKWLRFYYDFCHKYSLGQLEKLSLSAFIQKLKDKKQSEILLKQAQHAVSLFYELKLSVEKSIKCESVAKNIPKIEPIHSPDSGIHSKEIVSYQEGFVADRNIFQTNESIRDVLPKTTGEKHTGADWSAVFAELGNTIKLRHYSPKTLKSYIIWTRKFQTYLKSKDPSTLTVENVKQFLTWLAVDEGVSASSQNLAFSALLFLFRNVFGKEFGTMDGVVRAKKRPYIPVVLSRREVYSIFECMRNPHKLIIKLMYGCGLRISECLSLRVQNFNFDMMILTIHDGKGKKDRTVPLPETLADELRSQLKMIIELHEKDRQAEYDGVFLFGLLEKKYKNAAKELVWQWFFPTKDLTFISESNQYRRYHIHETSLQKALRAAVKTAKIPKRVTSHTFRHSFASHLLQANYDIRTIQELMGHSDIRTTMIYTHTVKSITKKEAKSPLDF